MKSKLSILKSFLLFAPLSGLAACGGHSTSSPPLTNMVQVTFTPSPGSNVIPSSIVNADRTSANLRTNSASIQLRDADLPTDPPNRTIEMLISAQTSSVSLGDTFSLNDGDPSRVEYSQTMAVGPDFYGAEWVSNGGTVTVTKLDADYIGVSLNNVTFRLIPGEFNPGVGTFTINGSIELIRSDRGE